MNQVSSFLLTVRDGPLAGTEFAVTGEVIVGRVDAAITVPDPEISRQHAVLRATPAGLEIEDLGSLNGTYVNGEQIKEPLQLRPDDLIRLGDTTMAVGVQDQLGTVQTDRVKEPPAPLAVPASGLPPLEPFSPPQPPRRRRAPASRSAVAMVLTVGTVVTTAVALIVYFALH